MQAAGLIQLKDGVGAQASINDVTGNPKKLQIVEVEGPQLVRAADDLALVQGYPAHFVNAGQAELASNALQYSTVDDLYYAIRFVSRSSHRDDSRIRQFVDIYQNSPVVAAQIDKSFRWMQSCIPCRGEVRNMLHHTGPLTLCTWAPCRFTA